MCKRCTLNSDEMFKCDFNDLFTQISLQFIAIEVIRNKCTRANTITESKEENHEKIMKTLGKYDDYLDENVFKTVCMVFEPF